MKTYCRLYEDNAATTAMMISGKTSSLRALNRTHRVSLAWVFEVSNGKHLEVRQIDSANQRADIFTKGFPVKRAWTTAQHQVGVTVPNVWGSWRRKGVIAHAKLTGLEVPESLGDEDNSEAGSAMVAAHDDPSLFPRTLIEWCCGESSVLSSPNENSAGCSCVRITDSIDARSQAAYELMKNALRQPNPHLWASIPCTGGCTYAYLNRRRKGGEARLRSHWELFQQLWQRFTEAAIACHKAGGTVTIEWPRTCRYWKLRCVAELEEKIGMKRAKFDGCQLGLRSIRKGLPIKKPWMISTSCMELHEKFHDRTCQGCVVHALCAGVDTKPTEDYTIEMAIMIHEALIEWAVKRRINDRMSGIQGAIVKRADSIVGLSSELEDELNSVFGFNKYPSAVCVAWRERVAPDLFADEWEGEFYSPFGNRGQREVEGSLFDVWTLESLLSPADDYLPDDNKAFSSDARRNILAQAGSVGLADIQRGGHPLSGSAAHPAAASSGDEGGGTGRKRDIEASLAGGRQGADPTLSGGLLRPSGKGDCTQSDFGGPLSHSDKGQR